MAKRTVKWSEPPPEPKRAPSKWDKVADDLRANPGKWMKQSYKTVGIAYTMKRYILQIHPDLTIEVRGNALYISKDPNV